MRFGEQIVGVDGCDEAIRKDSAKLGVYPYVLLSSLLIDLKDQGPHQDSACQRLRQEFVHVQREVDRR